MGITDRVFDGLKAAVQLSTRVEAMSYRMESLAREVREIDRRLIRVEPALELATSGRFAALPPAGDEGRGED